MAFEETPQTLDRLGVPRSTAPDDLLGSLDGAEGVGGHGQHGEPRLFGLPEHAIGRPVAAGQDEARDAGASMAAVWISDRSPPVMTAACRARLK